MSDDPHDEHPGLRWRRTGRLVPLAQLIGHDECTCWIGHCAEHPVRARPREPRTTDAADPRHDV